MSQLDTTRNFAFLLCPQFSLIAFAAAIEPLRSANRAAQRTLYTWTLVSADGGAVSCSNGSTISADTGLIDQPRGTTVVVCAGLDLVRAEARPVLTWLRKQARLGARIAGVCTGAHVIARTGLLDGKRATIHWENQSAFAEDFPEVELSTLLYCIEDQVITCAGGTSATDMMLFLIGEHHGPDFASLVADRLVHTPIRGAQDNQRLSVPARIGVRHPKLVQIIQTMERSTEEPVSPAELARSVNMSTRQLERLFRRYLNRSPKRYYMELRLEKARNLLLQTDMSVINVALACGFTSPSHFSKCYRSHFDRTPYRERGNPARGTDPRADSWPEMAPALPAGAEDPAGFT
ncbi:MAG: GlxA family transcriptional regulator [Paracoccaceae bacterium]